MLKHAQARISLIVCFAMFVTAGAQQRPETAPQDDRLRITTNLIQLDVVVTDKDGRQVTDLRPEDFEVSESGKRQSITNFSYVANVGANAGVPSGNQPVT